MTLMSTRTEEFEELRPLWPNIYQISQSLILQWGQIAAGTVIIIVPGVILFAPVRRWLVEGLLAGAVKG